MAELELLAAEYSFIQVPNSSYVNLSGIQDKKEKSYSLI